MSTSFPLSLFATSVDDFFKWLTAPDENCVDEQICNAEEELDEGIPARVYRTRTGRLLRRYLLATMQIARSPSPLDELVVRGRVSHHQAITFEETTNFVVDVERCLLKLTLFDRDLLNRILMQEYTCKETAALLGISARTVANRLPQAINRLTELFLEADLLEPLRQEEKE